MWPKSFDVLGLTWHGFEQPAPRAGGWHTALGMGPPARGAGGVVGPEFLTRIVRVGWGGGRDSRSVELGGVPGRSFGPLGSVLARRLSLSLRPSDWMGDGMGDGMPLRRGIVSPQIHICSVRFLFLFLHPDEGDYPCARARARYSFRRGKVHQENAVCKPDRGAPVAWFQYGPSCGRLPPESLAGSSPRQFVTSNLDSPKQAGGGVSSPFARRCAMR